MTGNACRGGEHIIKEHIFNFLVHQPSLHVFAVGKKLKTVGGVLPANKTRANARLSPLCFRVECNY